MNNPPRRIPGVRPPMHAGGGVGDPFGNSGAPGMPPPSESAKRARDEAIERYALARGRWFERLFIFPAFDTFAASTPTLVESTQSIDIKSNGDSFVRLVAMRGVVATFGAAPLGGNYETVHTFFQMEIDGLEDFTTSGRTVQPSSFDMAFSESAAPWLWLAAPPILRVGETVAVKVTIDPTVITGEVAWQPQFGLRLVDDNVWCELYGY